MAYTPSGRQGSPGSGPASQFGPGRMTANKQPIPNANVFQTQDATASPNGSPLTVNTTATLTVPLDATSVTIMSVTNALQISEDSTQSAYFSLPAGIPFTIDCADQQFIYLKVASSTVVSFMFHRI